MVATFETRNFAKQKGMELRLARAGLRALLVNGFYGPHSMRRGVAFIPNGIPADPAVHSGQPSDIEAEAAKAKAANKLTTDTDPLVPPKPPVSPSPKLENTLNQPINPTTQKKRRTTSTMAKPMSPDDVACVGIDGGSWPEEKEERAMGRRKKEQEDDNKEYFKHHKASPLSEIEVADTRKPISRATNRTADSYAGYFGDGDVVLFSDEQRDSADDSLRRATEMWRERAMRGDPDSPQGRVLRALRGEN